MDRHDLEDIRLLTYERLRTMAVRAGCVASGILLLGACASETQAPQTVYLGPDAVQTVQVDSPTVLYRVGDQEGSGQIEQGDALLMAPVPGGGFLMYTSYYGPDQRIQHWRDGKLVRTFGRVGQGPGEYTRVSGLAVDQETGITWVFDPAGRLVSYDTDGNPGETIRTLEVGATVMDLAVLPDGSLLINAPGGVTSTFGSVLHRYDRDVQRWAAHHPVFRDSIFDPNLDRRWIRKLGVSSHGRVAAVSDEYEIEVLQPDRDFRQFEVEAVIRRRPAGWPEDVANDNARRREEDPISPPFYVKDAWVDRNGHLWVLTGEPEDGWETEVEPDPRRPWRDRSLSASPDKGFDTLIEVFDLHELKILASFRIDPHVRYVLGPGIFAHYIGDLPYPQFEVIQITRPAAPTGSSLSRRSRPEP